MSDRHEGNVLNQINQEEHDPVNYAKRVTVVSGGSSFSGNVTLNPSPNFIGIVTVANPGSAAISGNVTLDPGSKTGIVGNLTLSDSKGFIGLTTVVQASSARTITGNLTLSDSKGFIGLTTTTLGASPAFIGIVTVANPSSAALSGNVTLDPGSKTGIVGNITLSDPKGFIGLVTVVGSLSPAAGNVTLDPGSRTGLIGTVTIQDGGNSITVDGNVGILGNVTLSDSKSFIGLVTVVQSSSARTITGNLTLSDSKGFIGLVTIGGGLSNVGVVGNLTLSDSKGFIGLVTAITKNGGTTKTLIPMNVSFAQSSISTIAVPSNTFNMTSIILNSNATVGMRIKSGATYLIGNVSLSVMLNPGGGWVQHGTPDSPVYKGLAGAAAIVLEKEDFGSVAEIAGHLMYFDE